MRSQCWNNFGFRQVLKIPIGLMNLGAGVQTSWALPQCLLLLSYDRGKKTKFQKIACDIEEQSFKGCVKFIPKIFCI